MRAIPATPSIDALRAVVSAACASRQVARVDVFGSVAKQTTHPESDVDLLVEFLPGANIGLLEMGSLKEELEERLGCPVDLLSRPAIERSRNPYRRRSILENLVPVYAR
jgi:predicted nucleotidyltransferase